jgi:hypothetical protein
MLQNKKMLKCKNIFLLFQFNSLIELYNRFTQIHKYIY